MALVNIKLGGFVEENIKGLNDNFSDLETRKAGTADIPTKTSQLQNDSGFASESYVDSKISSVYRYKGTVVSYTELPASGQEIGDTYNIEAANQEHNVRAGDNAAWNGTDWDVLSGLVDLSSYATNEAMNAELAEKVDAETGKGLSANDYTTAEKEKLAGLENYALPIGGEALGGVKNGGNVTINADGTMTAPASEQGPGVIWEGFTAGDTRWGEVVDNKYTLTVASGGKSPIGVYRKNGEDCGMVMADVTISGGDIKISSYDKFEGYILSI